MSDLRRLAALAVALCAACSAPQSPSQRTQDAELAALAPLRATYQGVVMGFDIHDPGTLVVSLDEQNMIDQLDQGSQDQMERDVLARWRATWTANHPHERALLTARFVDFRGNTIGELKN